MSSRSMAILPSPTSTRLAAVAQEPPPAVALGEAGARCVQAAEECAVVAWGAAVAG